MSHNVKDMHQLLKLVTALRATNSSTDKVKILKEILPESRTLLKIVYDPLVKFHVTSANVIKKGKPIDMHSSVLPLLNDLATKRISGQNALDLCKGFAEYLRKTSPDLVDLFYCMLDKNLKARIDTGLINEAIPDLIWEPNPALADRYDKLKKPLDFVKDRWFWSRKLDGCRCHAMIDEDGNIEFMSRGGHSFETLGKVAEDLKALDVKNVVFDGEIVILDENGNENFADIMKEIKRKDHTIERPCYMIFDMLTMDEFVSGKGSRTLVQRYRDMPIFVNYPAKHLRVVEQNPIMSQSSLTDAIALALSKNWEGLILRKDVGYEGKRTKNMLKVKAFDEAEYKVVGAENDFMRVIKGGHDVSELMLANVIIEHKGCKVSVGTGFSIEQRRRFFEHPEEIIGKIITVAFFEETSNQKGGVSLRFPTVKAIHGDKRDV